MGSTDDSYSHTGPKEREARNIFRKVRNVFFVFEDGFCTHHSEKSAGSDCNQHKGRGKDQEGKGMEGACQSGFSASEGTQKREIASRGNQTIGIPALLTIPLALLLSGLVHGVARDILHGWRQSPLNLANHPTHVVLDLGCTRSIGSREAIKRFQKHAFILWHYYRVLPLQ